VPNVEGVSRADCTCCRNGGALPGPYVADVYGRLLSQEISAEVVEQMCDQCTAAAFIPGRTHPHSMAGARRALRDAGYTTPNRKSGD
jgi:hypothetical protein